MGTSTQIDYNIVISVCVIGVCISIEHIVDASTGRGLTGVDIVEAGYGVVPSLGVHVARGETGQSRERVAYLVAEVGLELVAHSLLVTTARLGQRED